MIHAAYGSLAREQVRDTTRSGHRTRVEVETEEIETVSIFDPRRLGFANQNEASCAPPFQIKIETKQNETEIFWFLFRVAMKQKQSSAHRFQLANIFRVHCFDFVLILHMTALSTSAFHLFQINRINKRFMLHHDCKYFSNL